MDYVMDPEKDWKTRFFLTLVVVPSSTPLFDWKNVFFSQDLGIPENTKNLFFTHFFGGHFFNWKIDKKIEKTVFLEKPENPWKHDFSRSGL